MIIYGLLELLRFKKLNNLPYWFYIKASMVILGAIFGIIAIFTGEMIEDMFESGPYGNVMRTHSFFANLSTWIFAIIALFYIILWIEKQKIFAKVPDNFFKKILDVLLGISHFVINTSFVFIIVLAGLIAITITGALGGAMVYGPDVDLAVSYIYHLFFQ